jgi:hypothetical protein
LHISHTGARGWKTLHFGCYIKVAETSAAIETKHVHATFLLFEVVLLRAYDAARTANSQPSYGFARSKAVVFHEVESDKRACSPEASKAVHCYDALRLFGDAQELVDDAVAGHSTVLEREVKVLEASTLENCR